MALTYDELHDAVAGDGVGVRACLELEPLDGPGGKVFPPTYATGDRAETKYAVEQRRIPGRDEPVECVVLASVSDVANRQELALLDAYRAGELDLPVVSTDFSGQAGVERLGRISSLETPHRVFDALLRDSFLDGLLFRASPPGQAIVGADRSNAAALYHWSPTTLLFGGWDSTGPKGGQGAKYERAITSEIVAINTVRGVKTSSRIDPAGIQLQAGPVYEAAVADPASDLAWTLDEADAAHNEKTKKPVKVGEAKKGKEVGRPSQINHGNVTPSIDSQAGGVTAERIELSTVLSFIQLRRLRFPCDHTGSMLDGRTVRDAEVAAHTTLAALGLTAAVLAYEDGFDLRSRCVLRARSDQAFELIRRGSAPSSVFNLSRDDAVALLRDAVDHAGRLGLPWAGEEVILTPAGRLVELVRKSQEIPTTDSGSDDADEYA